MKQRTPASEAAAVTIGIDLPEATWCRWAILVLWGSGSAVDRKTYRRWDFGYMPSHAVSGEIRNAGSCE